MTSTQIAIIGLTFIVIVGMQAWCVKCLIGLVDVLCDLIQAIVRKPEEEDGLTSPEEDSVSEHY